MHTYVYKHTHTYIHPSEVGNLLPAACIPPIYIPTYTHTYMHIYICAFQVGNLLPAAYMPAIRVHTYISYTHTHNTYIHTYIHMLFSGRQLASSSVYADSR